MKTRIKTRMNSKLRVIAGLGVVSLLIHSSWFKPAIAGEYIALAAPSNSSNSVPAVSIASEPMRLFASVYYVDDKVTEQIVIQEDIVYRLTTRNGPAGGPCSMASEGLLDSAGVVTVRHTILSNNRTCLYASDLVSYRLDPVAAELITEYGHIRLGRQ